MTDRADLADLHLRAADAEALLLRMRELADLGAALLASGEVADVDAAIRARDELIAASGHALARFAEVRPALPAGGPRDEPGRAAQERCAAVDRAGEALQLADARFGAALAVHLEGLAREIELLGHGSAAAAAYRVHDDAARIDLRR
jgi:hypothetical protein